MLPLPRRSTFRLRAMAASTAGRGLRPASLFQPLVVRRRHGREFRDLVAAQAGSAPPAVRRQTQVGRREGLAAAAQKTSLSRPGPGHGCPLPDRPTPPACSAGRWTATHCQCVAVRRTVVEHPPRRNGPQRGHQREQGHAVVLGGGFAGLVTAGALAEFYQQVTVVDRDPAPAPGEYRRGAPQGRHAHNLLPGGARVPRRVFPESWARWPRTAPSWAVRARGLPVPLRREGTAQVPIGVACPFRPPSRSTNTTCAAHCSAVPGCASCWAPTSPDWSTDGALTGSPACGSSRHESRR